MTAAAFRLPVRRARRWWLAAAGAWVAGAVGGVAPTMFLGDPSPGLAASAALGLLAVAFLSPLLVTPTMATLVADDDVTQVSVAMHTAGLGVRTRIPAHAAVTAETSLILPALGAVAGVVAGLGLAHRSADPFAVGLRSAPTVGGALAGLGVVLASWALAVLVATAAVTPTRALAVLVLGFVVTGLVGSFVYFVPALRPLFWVMPWAALWPFDLESFDSAPFAASIPVAVRLASGAAWLTVLAAAAVRRLRVAPYPTTSEPRGRRRRLPTRP
jgi:hypothetical protein